MFERRETSADDHRLCLKFEKIVVIIVSFHRHEQMSDQFAWTFDDQQPIALIRSEGDDEQTHQIEVLPDRLPTVWCEYR